MKSMMPYGITGLERVKTVLKEDAALMHLSIALRA